MPIFKEVVMKVNILGTKYTLEERNAREDRALEGLDGYCDTSVKKMVVEEMKEKAPGQKEDLPRYKASTKRHEIIHGFLYESGLDVCCEWACEEMVDWLAIQFPKLQKAFKEAGCL